MLSFELESGLLVIKFYSRPLLYRMTIFTTLFCKVFLHLAIVRVLVALRAAQGCKFEAHSLPLCPGEQLVMTLDARNRQMCTIKGIPGLQVLFYRETGG